MSTYDEEMVIRIGHSPDPDDAFMFYGFASGKVTIPGCRIEHVLQDIQTLNVMAAGPDPLEVSAMSLRAFFDVEDRYELLEVGTSVGRGYGPRVVALRDMPLESLEGQRIALPGPRTTAAMMARGLLPPFQEVHMDFREIIGQVQSGAVAAGVIIHEGQLTYADQGLRLLADLGVLFSERHGGLPLPLGVNCVRRDIAAPLKSAILDAYRASVEVALACRAEAVEYSLAFARGLDKATADRFIGMYVNEDSLLFKADLREAIDVIRRHYAGVTAGNKTVHNAC